MKMEVNEEGKDWPKIFNIVKGDGKKDKLIIKEDSTVWVGSKELGKLDWDKLVFTWNFGYMTRLVVPSSDYKFEAYGSSKSTFEGQDCTFVGTLSAGGFSGLCSVLGERWVFEGYFKAG